MLEPARQLSRGIQCQSGLSLGSSGRGATMPEPRPGQSRITTLGMVNNRFRAELLRRVQGHHRILATQGVHSMGIQAVEDILNLVLAFKEEDFRSDFEPWGDRDFIVVENQGQKIWAKIDAYDLDQSHSSPNPLDDAVTVRVLTLMLPQEH